MARALHPSKILVVEVIEPIVRDFVQRPERYDGLADEVRVTQWGGGDIDPTAVGWALDDVDLVFSHETFYDERIVRNAELRGVASCLMSMPEFHRPDLPAPAVTWLPTAWRAEHHRAARIVPVPVALDRFGPMTPTDLGPARWLHVAGNRAAADRNGTATVLAALRLLRRPASVTFTVQRGKLPTPPKARVSIAYQPRHHGPYWQLFDGFDALVLPRRYGGLCLPVQEAMAAGMAVVLPDVPPNREWPALLVASRRGQGLRTSAGIIDTWSTPAANVARAMDALADPGERDAYRVASRAWAVEHSWDALAPLYRDELARAANLA